MYEVLKQSLPPRLVQWSENAALIRSCEELDALSLPATGIYALPAPEAELSPFIGRCHVVAQTKRQLSALEQCAAGHPFSVGLLLHIDGDDNAAGFSVDALGDLRAFLQTLPRVSVAGCLIDASFCGAQGAALGRFFTASYQAAKTMSAVVPCAMPYFGVCGALAALEENRRRSPATLPQALTPLETVAMQNDTAFYARFLLF